MIIYELRPIMMTSIQCGGGNFCDFIQQKQILDNVQ